MLPSIFLGQKRLLSILFFIIFSSQANAQFNLLWEKPIATNAPGYIFKNITSVNEVAGMHVISYIVDVKGKQFPGLACIDAEDKLTSYNDLSSFAELENFQIVGVVEEGENKLIAFGNDYNVYHDALPSPRPAEIKLNLTANKELTYNKFASINVKDVSEISSIKFTDVYNGKNYKALFCLQFHGPNKDYTKLFTLQNGIPKKNTSFENTVGLRSWAVNETDVVISYDTKFPAPSTNKYYTLLILDSNLVEQRRYPETTEYLKAAATDEIVDIDYRGDYHLGFLARQVRNIQGINFWNVFLFNSFPTGTYNKLVGTDKNVLIGESVQHPSAYKLVDSYQWDGANLNNWAILLDSNANKKNAQLVFSLNWFTGLQMSQLRVGDTEDKDNPDMIASHAGLGAINPLYPSIKCFSKSSDRIVYVINNVEGNTDRKPGIYISKWQIDNTDIRLTKAAMTTKYGKEVFYSTGNINSETTKDKFVLVDIDPSDPNFEKKDKLANEIVTINGILEPMTNTWYWKGPVKINGKKYNFTKFVIAKAF